MDLSGQTILLTGGTGSFGNAASWTASSATIPTPRCGSFSRDELKQRSEMQERYGNHPQLRFFVGDIPRNRGYA